MVVCEGAVRDAHEASAACWVDCSVAVDADSTSRSSSLPEVCDVDPGSGVASEDCGSDVEEVEASSIDGTPSLPQGGVCRCTCTITNTGAAVSVCAIHCCDELMHTIASTPEHNSPVHTCQVCR